MAPPVISHRTLAFCFILAFATSVALAENKESRHRENIVPPPFPAILSVSTIPATGDSNPYGVAFVPEGFPSGGPLEPGDVLVSNFNGGQGFQGTGTTIMQIKQNGAPASVFFQGSPGLGLTTALGVLEQGFVLVGSVPTTDGACDTITAGALLIIDRFGNLVTTLTDDVLLNGPWDLTVHEKKGGAQVFVSNVLGGTVTRLDIQIPHGGSPEIESETQIASGYSTACNQAAVVVGPTGLAFDSRRDILYVASTDDNTIFAIHHASEARHDDGTGRLVYQDGAHLHGPLALALAPNGHLLTANGDAVFADPNHFSEIVEFTREGHFVSEFQVDPVVGSAFGLAIIPVKDGALFAAVDDNTSFLEEWFVPLDND